MKNSIQNLKVKAFTILLHAIFTAALVAQLALVINSINS